ncbi:hypothetical protein WR25_24866 [Diploscapter pachys]|uniref:C2H2-type domain-containing protein n=1 Tax=Diploscapter pachys TaxID=2018661 RepID=A0A2A2L4N1_9BILA|nr:hypothetical protein WR25_24866 [Diploscapter pachys]
MTDCLAVNAASVCIGMRLPIRPVRPRSASPNDSGIDEECGSGSSRDCADCADSLSVDGCPSASSSSASPAASPFHCHSTATRLTLPTICSSATKRRHSAAIAESCLRDQKVRKMSSFSTTLCNEVETSSIVSEATTANEVNEVKMETGSEGTCTVREEHMEDGSLEHFQLTPSTSSYSPACLGAVSSSSSSSSLCNEPNEPIPIKEKSSLSAATAVVSEFAFKHPGKISEEDEAKISLSCHWGNCLQLRNDKDALYDHVVEDHIKNPIPMEPRQKGQNSTSTMDSDESEESDAEEMDAQTCQWKDCHMRLKRGNVSKKMSWLEEHFRTRHAFGAHPFRCLLTNCTARFVTSRQLDEHVRRGHFEYAVKCGVGSTAAVNGKDEEAHGLRWEPEPMSSLWVRHQPYSVDDYLIQKIHDRMQVACILQFDVGFVPIKYNNLKGSARRKAYNESHFYITSAAGRMRNPAKQELSECGDSFQRHPTMEELMAEWRQEKKQQTRDEKQQ